MVRDTIAVTATVRDGVLLTDDPPSAGNNAEFANSAGRTLLIYVNGLGAASGQATDITIQQVADPYGRIQNAGAFTVPVDRVAVLGPFPPLLYNQADGTVQVDYDAVDAGAEQYAVLIAGA